MKTAALAAEMRHAAANLPSEDREILVQGYGIPCSLVDLYQLIGLEKIVAKDVKGARRDLYMPHADGDPAFITPVLGHFADTPESTDPRVFVRFGNIIDLLAWDPRYPDRWALRTGAATWLGCVPPQYLEPFPVRVWRSP